MFLRVTLSLVLALNLSFVLAGDKEVFQYIKAVSTAAETKAQDYQFVEFASAAIDQNMYIAKSPELPQALHGLWWMDGNPLPDEVVSFGGSSWNAETKQTTIEVYGAGVWTWHTTHEGFDMYESVLKSKIVYEFTFNDDISFAQIIPTFSLNGVKISVPKWLANFTMRLKSDGHWVRETKFFGVRSGDYQLRRIVKGNGEHEAAFDDFVFKAPSTLFTPVTVD